MNVPSTTHAGCQVALYIERVECVRVRPVLVSVLHRDQSIMKAGRRTKTFAELCVQTQQFAHRALQTLQMYS